MDHDGILRMLLMQDRPPTVLGELHSGALPQRTCSSAWGVFPQNKPTSSDNLPAQILVGPNPSTTTGCITSTG
eukprot:4925543-Heterocapsa_arctica.AAC.1